MKLLADAIAGPLLIEPDVFEDARGFFFESFNRRGFEKLAGFVPEFVQDNCSGSAKNVLRGLHYQVVQPQGKLIQVVAGEIFDVVVDLRRSSPTLGKWLGHRLSAENRRMLWVPPGFAHGFLTLSDESRVSYKITGYWSPAHERAIRWDDPDLAINWPLHGAEPILSQKDQDACSFREAALFP